MIPITGWLPEPADWVIVVAIFAAILLELGGLKVGSVELYSSRGSYTSPRGVVAEGR